MAIVVVSSWASDPISLVALRSEAPTAYPRSQLLKSLRYDVILDQVMCSQPRTIYVEFWQITT